MSVTPAGAPLAAARPRRVRHQARDQLTLMVFSALTSGVLAGGFLLLTTLAR